jgi:magnesium transporter
LIHSFAYIPGQELQFDIPVADYERYLSEPKSLLWVDFVSEPDENCEPILSGVFHFHPLAVDDALKETHIPKVDDWGDYLYMVMNSLDHREMLTSGTEIMELDIFLGRNFVVTHHDAPFPAVEKAHRAIRQDERYSRNGADYLLYKILDDLVAEYWPIIERVDAEIDEIEDRVFNDPGPHLLERLFAMKRLLVAMRRILSPQREVLNRLARDEFAVIDRKDRVLFRDIYDHVVRLHDLNEGLRDLVGGTMDSYLSVINNRMNEIMKTLTIITVLFMPITFVTGFYGMNFFQPVAVELGAWTGLSPFVVAMAILIALPIIMLLWLRRRRWL